MSEAGERAEDPRQPRDLQQERADRLTIVLLGIISLFLFADQNLLAPNLTQIAREFGFTDLERDRKLGGDIALVFWLFGGAITLVVGWLTDRLPRRPLFVAVVLIGELPCLLTGFAQTYEQLFWLRALTGVGIGGALPLIYSLLGDLFDARGRALAAGFLGFAMGAGIAVGQLAAGFLGPEYGWRLPFVWVALPNFLLAPLFYWRVREPRRGSREEVAIGRAGADDGAIHLARPRWSDYGPIFRVRTNVLVFLQGIPGTVPWGVFFVFLNDFYAQDKGYSVAAATLIVLVLGAFAIVGNLVGGVLGQWVYNRSPAGLPLLCAFTTLLGIVPTLALVDFPSQAGVAEPNVVTPLLLGAASGLLISITGVNVRAMLLDINRPDTRGSVFALCNLADDLGRGLGPAIIAVLIGAFGRLSAFRIAALFWAFCGLVLLLMVRTFPADEERLRRELEAEAARSG